MNIKSYCFNGLDLQIIIISEFPRCLGYNLGIIEFQGPLTPGTPPLSMCEFSQICRCLSPEVSVLGIVSADTFGPASHPLGVLELPRYRWPDSAEGGQGWDSESAGWRQAAAPGAAGSAGSGREAGAGPRPPVAVTVCSLPLLGTARAWHTVGTRWGPMNVFGWREEGVQARSPECWRLSTLVSTRRGWLPGPLAPPHPS